MIINLFSFIGLYLSISFCIYLLTSLVSLFITSSIKILFISRNLWIGLFFKPEKGKIYIILIPTIVILINYGKGDYIE